MFGHDVLLPLGVLVVLMGPLVGRLGTPYQPVLRATQSGLGQDALVNQPATTLLTGPQRVIPTGAR